MSRWRLTQLPLVLDDELSSARRLVSGLDVLKVVLD